MFLRFTQISGEERPRGAGAVDLVEHGTTGTGDPVSVAEVGCDVEGEMDRPLSESAPTSRTTGPAGLDPGAPYGVWRVAMRETDAVTMTALRVFAASLIPGCAPDGRARSPWSFREAPTRAWSLANQPPARGARNARGRISRPRTPPRCRARPGDGRETRACACATAPRIDARPRWSSLAPPIALRTISEPDELVT